ncbi:MAG: hypothetical protein EZS28_008946, partial [Streblomastix strix]
MKVNNIWEESKKTEIIKKLQDNIAKKKNPDKQKIGNQQRKSESSNNTSQYSARKSSNKQAEIEYIKKKDTRIQKTNQKQSEVNNNSSPYFPPTFRDIRVTPNKTLDDWGGYEEEIKKLLGEMQYITMLPGLCQQLNQGTKTILLTGPTGVGKTHLAQCIAGTIRLSPQPKNYLQQQQSQSSSQSSSSQQKSIDFQLNEIPFFSVSASELVGGITGQTESNIRSIFKQAQDKSPSLLLIDDIDSIVPRRMSDSDGGYQ